MLRHISICVTLVMLGMSPLRAQQQEAALQQVALPGAGLDVVLATPKSPATIIDLGNTPEALIVYLIGDELVLPFEDGTKMLEAIDHLRRPACTFKAESNGPKLTRPVAMYVVPARERPANVRTASVDGRLSAAAMQKVEVPGTKFAIVFATTNPPIALKPNEWPDALAVYSVGSELIMAIDGDIKKMFKDVGLSQWPMCAFYVEQKGSNPPQATSVYIVPTDETTD
jgi:hypothetical protein